MYSLKYDLFNKPLELKKTHDVCISGKPRLTVVFIHGIASDSGTFTNALRYLEGTRSLEDVRFVTYDLLGSGKSYENDRLNYDYRDQLGALENSLKRLQYDTPLVLVGHSMGTLIATKYAYDHKKTVKNLVLVSPPVYTPENLEDKAFAVAMNDFKRVVSVKDKKYINNKAFEQEINKIVLNKYNYGRLHDITTPATLIYSDADQIIMPMNIHKIARENKKYLKEIRTIGSHRVARDKYIKIREVLEEVLNA